MIKATPEEQRQMANKRLLKTCAFVVIGMFGFGYAMVPLYNVMCKTLGINGKTGGQVSYMASADQVDKDREITIEFVATNNESLPWQFYPNLRKVSIHPGEQKRITFFAENDTDNTMIVQAIPSVSPSIAAKYLKKTECFCFTQQTMASHEHRDMPIIFHIDKAIPKNINTITLSYTLFDVTEMKLKANKKAGKIA